MQHLVCISVYCGAPWRPTVPGRRTVSRQNDAGPPLLLAVTKCKYSKVVSR